MSLVVAAIAAAGVGLAAGAIGLGAWLRRRRRNLDQAAGSEPPRLEAPAAGPAERAPVELYDVVAVEDETRWLCSGLRAQDGVSSRCTLLFASEEDGGLLVVAFPPPARHVYWLARHDLALPPTPPSCLEVQERLLQRVATFPATLEPLASPPLAGGDAVVSWYEGAVGDAVVTLHGNGRCHAFAGQRLEPGAFDRMGTVPPDDGGGGSANAP